jgi:hypothetical protein
MRRLALPVSGANVRARRWDAIVLGGALPGLVAAARIAMTQQRVLLVEEEAVARSFAPLRDPFFLGGARTGGVLEACLRELTLPLIERRRIEPDPIAYQVVFPQARLDVGEPELTAEELVTWGLAEPEAAHELVRALEEAGAAEAQALLAAPVVRSAGLRARARSVGQRPPRHARGLPAQAKDPALAAYLEAQVRALSQLAEQPPSPEARARLLGSALAGGAGFRDSSVSLHGLLRRRLEALHVERATLPGGFELVSMGAEAGVLPERSREAWVARSLVLNAPRGVLRAALEAGGHPVPSFLEEPLPTHRRLVRHWSVSTELLPEGMARRVICVPEPARPATGGNVVTLAQHPDPRDPRRTDLVGSVVVRDDAEELAEGARRIEAALEGLAPFAVARLEPRPAPVARWDDAGALLDPPRGASWPCEVEIQASSKPRVYALAREGLAGLGLEGELLLGWRAGDLIRADLA